MNMLLLIFVAGLCMYVAGKILSSEERNRVFSKYSFEVEDVKKYNRFCAILVIAFGVVAELTLALSYLIEGWYSILFNLLLIAEAVIVMKIYSKGEKKMMKKR